MSQVPADDLITGRPVTIKVKMFTYADPNRL